MRCIHVSLFPSLRNPGIPVCCVLAIVVGCLACTRASAVVTNGDFIAARTNPASP